MIQATDLLPESDERLAQRVSALLVCPMCKGKLKVGCHQWVCDRCQAVFFEEDGIPVMLPPNLPPFKAIESRAHTEIAEDYERLVQFHSWVSLHSHSWVLAELATIPSDALILDVGCGPGRDGIVLMRRGKSVVETDISLGMVKKAHDNTLMAGLSSRGYHLVMDAEHISFPPHVFDAVLIFATLHHLMNPTKGLGQIVECLKPGGLLVVGMEPNTWYYRLVRPLGKIVERLTVPWSKKDHPVRTRSIAEATTTGFSKRRLLQLAAQTDLSVVKIEPIWFLTGFAQLFVQASARIGNRDLKLGAGLGKLLIRVDEWIGNIPIVNHYPWHWNLVAVKKDQAESI